LLEQCSHFVDAWSSGGLEIDVMRPVEVERMVLAVARGQHGVISVAQLAELGLSPGWIQHRLARGWLRRLHRGVYLVGPIEAERSRAMAATLATGPGALISHYPAAVLWCLRPPQEGPMHVTVANDKRDREGIHIHRAALHPADATRRHGIPVTSAARTLLDLAATTSVDRALNEARIHRLVSDPSLNEQFSRYPRHRGTAALKEAMRTEPKLTRSEAERRVLDLIREAGLPTPEANVRIAGYEVDLLWREQNLVVEIDGYAFHSSRRSFELDRRKQSALAAAGLRVARVTWRQAQEEAIAVAARLATALAA
jgi:very-short-patch-repair endonuclease